MINARGWLRSVRGAAGRAGEVSFRCNICDAHNVLQESDISREEKSCWRCGSTLRFRSLIHALSTRLYGESRAISAFDASAGARGIGFTDAKCYARRLASLDYVNTYFDSEPRVDIARPPKEYLERFDYAICSDVLEHVSPPVEAAFTGLYSMLRPGGVLVMSVPYVLSGTCTEHYPSLHHFRVETLDDGGFVIRNRTRSGEEEVFSNPVFHGGPGQTLEMRVFSETALLQQLRDAGFTGIHIHHEDERRFGVVQGEQQSLPVSAVRPLSTASGE